MLIRPIFSTKFFEIVFSDNAIYLYYCFIIGKSKGKHYDKSNFPFAEIRVAVLDQVMCSSIRLSYHQNPKILMKGFFCWT